MNGLHFTLSVRSNLLENKIIAAIDIGTNTLLLLIAKQILNDNFRKIKEHYGIARLGENVDKTSIISDEAINRTITIINEFKQICDNYKVDKILAVGTSALRDAKNSNLVLNKLNSILNTEIIIIDGTKEATLSYLGTVNDSGKCLLIDIGGGSTELIFGNNNEIIQKISLQIGAVRLTEKFFGKEYPPNKILIDQAKSYILEQLNSIKYIPKFDKVFAIAGTATTFATTHLKIADNEIDKVNGINLNKNDIRNLYQLYLTMSIEEIINKLLIHPQRADLIFTGSLIMDTIVDFFSIKEIIISSHGLRYGIIKDYLNKIHK